MLSFHTGGGKLGVDTAYILQKNAIAFNGKITVSYIVHSVRYTYTVDTSQNMFAKGNLTLILEEEARLLHRTNCAIYLTVIFPLNRYR